MGGYNYPWRQSIVTAPGTRALLARFTMMSYTAVSESGVVTRSPSMPPEGTAFDAGHREPEMEIVSRRALDRFVVYLQAALL